MEMYSETVDKPREIKMASVKALQKTLHAYNVEWAKELVNDMFPQNSIDKRKDPKNKVGLNKLYNIVSGQIKNNSARVSFILQGNKLLRSYKEKQDQAHDVVEQLSQSQS